MSARVAPIERGIVLVVMALAALALLLSGCVVYVPVPTPPGAPAALANPCDLVDCDRRAQPRPRGPLEPRAERDNRSIA